MRGLIVLGSWAALAIGGCGGDDGGGDRDAGSGADAGQGDAGRLADAGGCSAPSDCDDGLFCNGPETCSGGRCTPGTAMTCDDGVACTTDRCDEPTRACANEPPDEDGDGHADAACGGDDCDDEDVDRYPGNDEVCDASHDEDCRGDTLGDRDADGDMYVDSACCNGAACGSDCDDSAAGVHPTEAESCNTVDDDCDGRIDEAGSATAYRDRDGDGAGNPTDSITLTTCSPPSGFVLTAGDCVDTDPTIFIGAPERCDRLDNDCSLAGGTAGGTDPSEDADDDGHAPSSATCSGVRPTDDCNDADRNVHPGAPEPCNMRDDDCDGMTDEEVCTLCAAGYAACSSFTDMTGAASVTITQSGSSYMPRCLRIRSGTRVTIPAGTFHPSRQACGPAFEFASESSMPRTVTLTRTGLYGYYCTVHGNADGTGEAGAIDVVP